MLKITGSSDLAPSELRTDKVVGSGGKADKTVLDSSNLVEKSSKVENLQMPEKLQSSSVWKNVYQSTAAFII